MVVSKILRVLVVCTGFVIHPVLQAAGQTETQQIIASDSNAIDLFGGAIALDGNTLVVGATRDDDVTNDSGSVYLYTRDQAGFWGNEIELHASDNANGDWFGWSVALAGDLLVVGARLADGTGPLSNDEGRVYVFERNGGTWTETAILAGSDVAGNQYFGDAVATNGSTIAVGMYRDDDNGVDSGSVFLFERDNTGAWVQIDKLLRTGGQINEQFGNAIAMDGNALIVSAHRERTVSTDSGAAYVYRRTPAGWSLEDKLVSADVAAGDRFGFDVDISGDQAVVGAPGDSVAVGAAYVFTLSGGSWLQQDKLVGLDTEFGDQLGTTVAISGDRLVVGAAFEDELGLRAGAAYVFDQQPSGEWLQQSKLLAGDGRATGEFSIELDIDERSVVVGAWGARMRMGAAYSYTRFLEGECGGTFSLPFDEWRQITLPCTPPAGQASVQDIFGDDIGGVYETNWILYRFDPFLATIGDYVIPPVTASLSPGTGYWIKNRTAGEALVSLDMPAGSTPIAVDQFAGSNGCTATLGCREIALGVRDAEPTFNMLGYPFPSVGNLANWRVPSDAPTTPVDCSTAAACTLPQASDATLMFRTIYRWNGIDYDQLSSGSNINPWTGFWAVALDDAETNGASLLIDR